MMYSLTQESQAENLPCLPSLSRNQIKSQKLGGLARPEYKAMVLAMITRGFFHRYGRERPCGVQVVMPFPPLPAEGMRSSIGSLTPADPAFKPWPCTRAAKKVILKEKVGKENLREPIRSSILRSP